MFETVSRSLKYDSNFWGVHKHIYKHVYMNTNTDHFTQLVLHVRGNKRIPDLLRSISTLLFLLFAQLLCSGLFFVIHMSLD